MSTGAELRESIVKYHEATYLSRLAAAIDKVHSLLHQVDVDKDAHALLEEFEGYIRAWFGDEYQAEKGEEA